MGRGLTYILSAPAGTGKTTLITQLTLEFPHIVRSISYTTRAPRSGEENGIDYHFVSLEEFEDKIKKGHFLEYAQVFGHYYGTCKEGLENYLEKGVDVVLVIDTQGALKIKPFFEGVYIFMSPPSLVELEERLKKRKTESEADLKKRLEWAAQELKQATHYDYNIVNCDLNKTHEVLKSIFVAEKFKVRH